MDGPTFRTCPLAYFQRHGLDGMAAVRAAFAAWIPAVNADQFTPIPQRLVFKLLHELRPACVTDRLRETAVLLHVADSEAFDGDHLVFVYQPCRKFVQEIPAGVRYLCVQSCYLQFC